MSLYDLLVHWTLCLFIGWVLLLHTGRLPHLLEWDLLFPASGQCLLMWWVFGLLQHYHEAPFCTGARRLVVHAILLCQKVSLLWEYWCLPFPGLGCPHEHPCPVPRLRFMGIILIKQTENLPHRRVLLNSTSCNFLFSVSSSAENTLYFSVNNLFYTLLSNYSIEKWPAGRRGWTSNLVHLCR